jgi:hypothetical protein
MIAMIDRVSPLFILRATKIKMEQGLGPSGRFALSSSNIDEEDCMCNKSRELRSDITSANGGLGAEIRGIAG